MSPRADACAPTTHFFLVPPAGTPPSGGDRYNEGLIAALSARAPGTCVRLSPDALTVAQLGQAHGTAWLDSLLLPEAPRVRALLPAATPLRLIAHALPSELAAAGDRTVRDAAAREVALLASLQGALAPSATLARSLRARAPSLPTWVAEPAITAAPRTRTIDVARAPLSALLVGHLVPNKGVLPLLRALADPALSEAPFRLRCVGRADLDPTYARACAAVLESEPALAARVTLVGPLPVAGVRDELGRAELLISASLGESFGMVIADARASGLPVLARSGGHVDVQVTPDAGGELVADETSLARALAALARDPGERARRAARAQAARPKERSWSDVAEAVLAIPP